jgi:4-alpha-glucanotransferase
VAGVPPDYFSVDGQLWGNPVYNWDALRATGYRWCIDRLRSLLAHVDVIRLDHFRGFAAAWHVPAGATTAQSGQWVPGPGASFFQAVETELGRLPFIAEDLGLITPEVHALRDQFHVPGTRVLQFAFDGHADNPYLPHNFVSNTVVYTGTHDNATSREWYEDSPDEERRNFWGYLQRAPGEAADAAPALMRLAWTRRPYECARSCRRQLALAQYRKHAIFPGLEVAARIDRNLKAPGRSPRNGVGEVQTEFFGGVKAK